MVYFDIRYLFYDTVVTGGDTASWYGVARHLAQDLLPNGRLTGWDMGNFCGHPAFRFYFLPPFLLAVLPHVVLGIPLTISLKWAIMSGIFLLPVATYLGLRSMKYGFPVPIMGAGGSMLFMFNESYTMFGGNALSTFAGEFCYMLAFSIFAYFIGSFYKGYKTGDRAIKNGILLGLIGLSHLFVFIPAMMLLVYAFFDRARLQYLLEVGLTALACMAFWIIPLIAYRYPFTTPVYIIWQEFVNLRYTSAGILGVIVLTCPRFALFVVGQGKSAGYRWRLAFAVYSAVGIFAAAYLLGQYLFLGSDLWYTGLHVPGRFTGPLGKIFSFTAIQWVLPLSIAIGVIIGVLGLRCQASGSTSSASFYRIMGSICILVLILFFLFGLHTIIARALPGADLRERFLNGSILAAIYGPVVVICGGIFMFSSRFGMLLSRVAAPEGEPIPSDRFFMWLTLVFGCAIAYFSAHFLQFPDIRFLPPLIFALLLILCAETLGPFIVNNGLPGRIAIAVTVSYLVILAVIFGTKKSDTWYRFNNMGYEYTAGYSEFDEVNRYLKKVYATSGLDPLNAPRVGYEKCDLYGRFGGDRVFESIPVFSNRQTLEGVHYASSLSSRSIVFLQTEFSRDIKTPNALILSKMDPDALPAHFDLYNISQLVVMTDEAKKALSSSSLFEREATFADIAVFRYTKCNGRYVDVPKVRPVLYTGEKWADDFFAWFKDPARIDVLLVPDRYVIDDADRAIFSGKSDTVIDLDRFRSNVLDRENLNIKTHLNHLKIRFTTNKVGLPHLIKVSYFPNWTVQGARGVYPVSPHMMLVIPRENEVTLTYSRSFWELLGLWITVGWVVFLLGKTVLGFTGVFSRWKITYHRATIKWEHVWRSLERSAVGARPWIFALVIIGASGLVVAGAIYRNMPVRTYVAGNRGYVFGRSLSGSGKNRQAEKHFTKAIQIMAPLLDKRSRYDHRDVINSILLTAKCYENLNEYEKAERWYRTLLKEYPYSRYIAEGYVRIARIYKRRMRPRWRDGLNQLRKGRNLPGAQLLKDGFSLLEKSLLYYHRAIQEEPYSIWAGYAKADMEKQQKWLDKIDADLYSLYKSSNDSPVRHLAGALRARLEEIREKPI